MEEGEREREREGHLLPSFFFLATPRVRLFSLLSLVGRDLGKSQLIARLNLSRTIAGWYLLNHDVETVPVRKNTPADPSRLIRSPARSPVVSHLPSAGPVSTRWACSVHTRHTQVTAPTVKPFLRDFLRQERQRERERSRYQASPGD